MGFVGDDGQFTGFDLDLAKEVASRLGLEFVPQPINWDAKDMELDSGNIDCIWNGFTINGREDKYTWTEAYMNNDQIVLVNPEIVEESGEQTGEEGCLSVPGKSGIVTRPNHVKVKAFNEDMEPIELEGEELLARAFCHEIDHLDGHLYVELAKDGIHDVEYEED